VGKSLHAPLRQKARTIRSRIFRQIDRNRSRKRLVHLSGRCAGKNSLRMEANDRRAIMFNDNAVASPRRLKSDMPQFETVCVP
jgi:hypothetical protein